MIEVAVELLAEFAKNATHGINAMAQGLPRLPFGSSTPYPAPPTFTIYSDIKNPEAFSPTEYFNPPKKPAVVIWGDSDDGMPLKGNSVSREVVICIAALTDESQEDLVGNRICGYIMRGAKLTYRRYNSMQLSQGYRSLNGVNILQIRRVREEKVAAPLGRCKLFGLLYLYVEVAETMQ